MGPEEQRQDEFEVKKSERVRVAFKKTVQKYFEDPLNYLLYGSIFLALIGTFLNLNLPWKFWALILVLGAARISEKKG